MEQREFLLRVVEAMQQAGIAYAITGSWASTTYGLPRTTHDLDVVVTISADQAIALSRSFEPPVYADAVSMAEAALVGTSFNIVDPISGLKVDFWPLQDQTYAQQQFDRRRQVALFGRAVWMLAPEDVILAKLLWYRQSESETQMRDCMTVWRVQKDALDQDYLRRWAAQLNLTELLNRVIVG